MKIGAMLGDVLRSLFKQPATERYPFERRDAPENLRGRLTWNPEKCTGCALCVMDCPANALELIEIDKKNKRFVLRYHMDRCTYCAQCVQSCRFKCLDMSRDDWELAALRKEPFSVCYGNEDDLATVMGSFTSTNARSPDQG